MKYQMNTMINDLPIDKGNPFTEEYNDDNVTTIEEARAAATAMIASFNNTLRPKESARTLVSVSLVENEPECVDPED